MRASIVKWFFFALLRLVFPGPHARRECTASCATKQFAIASRAGRTRDCCSECIPSFLRGRRSLSCLRHKSRSARVHRGGTPLETGAHPPTSHPGGQASDTIIPNSGRRSSEEGGPNLENGACRPRAVTAAAPSVRSGRSHAYLVCVSLAKNHATLDNQAGFSTAPSGTTPSLA